MSKIIESRERALKRQRIVSKPVNSFEDADQLISVLYAPSEATGFPDTSLGAFLGDKARPEVKAFIEQNILTSPSNDGSPDVDAALDTIIPRKAQYGNEIEPYMNQLRNFVQSERDKQKKKDE